MLESRVIKRCYPRFSVPSHLYARNAYDFFAFLPLFLPSSPLHSPFFQASSSKLAIDGQADCPSREENIYRKKKKSRGRERKRERTAWTPVLLDCIIYRREGRRNELDTMINYAIRGSRKINDRYYCTGSRAHTC